jgi:hypothetical protein
LNFFATSSDSFAKGSEIKATSGGVDVDDDDEEHSEEIVVWKDGMD